MASIKRKKLKTNESASKANSDIQITGGPSEEYLSFFEKLPELPLIKIFTYLSYTDRRNAAFVCKRWYDISKCPGAWNSRVDIKVKISTDLLKHILVMPQSVKYLSLYSESFDRARSLWLPDVFTQLHKQCPELKSLIIENAFFAQRFCNVKFTCDHILHNSIKDSVSSGRKRRIQNALQCSSECFNSTKYIPSNRPQKLLTFSLRYTHSYISHLSSQISKFFPDIKVLDLTCSASIKTAAVPFFLHLQYLEELYLVECLVTNFALEILLKRLKSLKVLDLEGAHGLDDDTYMIILENGHSLEELYLGNTPIVSFPVNEDSFSHLQRICLRNTDISDSDISYFIVELPILKHIDISFAPCLSMKEIMRCESDVCDKVLTDIQEGDATAICHHFKLKHT